jgi:hypothetical protein
VTYWRRRFVVLTIVLAALAAADWGLSYALRVQHNPKPPATSSGQSGGAAGRHGGQTHQGGGAAPGAGGSPGSGATRHASASPSDSPSGGAGTRGGHNTGTATKHDASPSPSPGVSGGPGPEFCPWHSIVISLPEAPVGDVAGERLTFNVSVVSTQRADCSFNIGPGHLALVIRQGKVRIWSSADCVAGTGGGGLVTTLRRGVPTVVTIGWNKKTSAPDCGGHGRSVPAGTYEAHAVDASLTSASATFYLR